mmetsp:Transcript_43902/g.42427  ORF Transcript_43902/g.42427 Transcript_43902/m.42427 type:complete len:161 (-) Transcript_43902:1181-1663(-)
MVFEDRLGMVLDQYQPCYQYRVGIERGDYQASSVCNPNYGNLRDQELEATVYLGEEYREKLVFTATAMCPAFSDSIEDVCYEQINQFEILEDLVVEDLPSFAFFNEGNRELTVSPYLDDHLGSFSLFMFAINQYGMSVELTYTIIVEEMPEEPSSSSSSS